MTTHFSSNTHLQKQISERLEIKRKKEKNISKEKKFYLPPAKSWASGYSFLLCRYLFSSSFLMSVLLFSKAGEPRGILGVLFLYIVSEARPNCEVPEGHFTCILELRGRIVSFLFLFHTSLKNVRIRLTTKRFSSSSRFTFATAALREELCCSWEIFLLFVFYYLFHAWN